MNKWWTLSFLSPAGSFFPSHTHLLLLAIAHPPTHPPSLTASPEGSVPVRAGLRIALAVFLRPPHLILTFTTHTAAERVSMGLLSVHFVLSEGSGRPSSTKKTTQHIPRGTFK
ncbi:hypothetical protein GPALN_016359 [Globodera pallida]|nr:hypothetical protein GPALN_016359 [Globodera pallida]